MVSTIPSDGKSCSSLEMPYTIGTRGSLLALAQTRQVAKLLEEAGIPSLDIKIITTRGDKENQTSLAEMDGKDFFTCELDEALLQGEVDLLVHSYKDLGSERPEGVEVGAVTERFYAHDILFCHQHTVDSLKRGELKDFRVGTCSPRRSYNLKKYLGEFLPFGEKLSVTTPPLRGNVTTRLQQLRENRFEGVVLALAGLERLAQEQEAKDLLENLEYMVLPRRMFVPAAAQGALAIEIRKDCPGPLRQAVEKLNHAVTREEVLQERNRFQDYGGGCQLAVGIHFHKKRDVFVVMEHGFHEGKEIFRCHLGGERPAPKGKGMIVGRPNDEWIERVPCDFRVPVNEDFNLMVTSPGCLEALEKFNSCRQLFSSGERTHKKMAERGYWVHLCADALGEDEIIHLLRSKILTYMSGENKTYVLTGEGSVSKIGSVIPCYQRKTRTSCYSSLRDKLEAMDAFYWMSFPQYKVYQEAFPFLSDRQHGCGLGKTWEAFEQQGIEVIPFSGPEEFEKWWMKK